MKLPNSKKLKKIHENLIKASELLIQAGNARRQRMAWWISELCGKES